MRPSDVARHCHATSHDGPQSTVPAAEGNGSLTDSAFCAVFDSSDEALVLLDSEGIVKRANRRACELLRCKDAEILGAGLGTRLSRPASEEFQLRCRAAFSMAEIGRAHV